MATAPSLARTVKAAGIVQHGGVVPLANGGFVAIDAVHGSGKGHITNIDRCDCADHRYRGRICKYMLAVREAQGVVSCPTCSAATKHDVFYIGGRGYCTFAVCTADTTHQAQRLN